MGVVVHCSQVFLLLSGLPQARSQDSEALLALKASIDPKGSLQWGGGSDFCQWQCVKECLNGRVTKLVVERFNLSGTLDGKSLNQLDQLRVLSFKENSLSGQIPELSGLKNLKSLYLNNNKFSGRIPVSLSLMHRLKVIVLAGNMLSGQIPRSLVGLSRLYVLYLQDNRLTGAIPPFNQRSLRFFNVSNNALSGEIPATAPLVRGSANELQLGGSVEGLAETLGRGTIYKAVMESGYIVTVKRLKDARYPKMEEFRRHIEILGRLRHPNLVTLRAYFQAKEERLLVYDYSRMAGSFHPVWLREELILIVVLCFGGFALLCVVAAVWMVCLRKTSKETEARSKVAARGVEEGTPSGVASGGRDDSSASKQGGFSWTKGPMDLESCFSLDQGISK
ncbi:UNVERIFIED_CONTAM: Inactive leucine-rich repeat receptor-like serine/threonine-protein kinase [Sesamum radiatum]|uniref:Inactive leucine-rich repeat receptor-like serine/threonine-protein kinase n=1 Tax=Sesamum radiatum TaxID=300843 RepID=A0AAW2JPE2_SESRA